jgi:hypothetical protein
LNIDLIVRVAVGVMIEAITRKLQKRRRRKKRIEREDSPFADKIRKSRLVLRRPRTLRPEASDQGAGCINKI